jgi:hypothetical protein
MIRSGGLQCFRKSYRRCGWKNWPQVQDMKDIEEVKEVKEVKEKGSCR